MISQLNFSLSLSLSIFISFSLLLFICVSVYPSITYNDMTENPNLYLLTYRYSYYKKCTAKREFTAMYLVYFRTELSLVCLKYISTNLNFVLLSLSLLLSVSLSVYVSLSISITYNELFFYPH